MKIRRKIKGTPEAASLTVCIEYNLADIKNVLFQICLSHTDENVGITISDLTDSVFEKATGSHMLHNSRQYIAEWMVRRAIIEGFVFKANDYLGKVSANEDIYIVDAEKVRAKMRGVCNKKNK